MRRGESCCPRATASGAARDPLRSRAALASPNRLLVYKRRAPPAREDRRGVSRGDRKWVRELYRRCPGATTSYFGWRPSIFLGAQRTLRSIADRAPKSVTVSCHACSVRAAACRWYHGSAISRTRGGSAFLNSGNRQAHNAVISKAPAPPSTTAGT